MNVINIADHWRAALITREVGPKDDRKKVVVPIPANIATILRYHPSWKDKLAFCEHSGCIVKTGTMPWDKIDAPMGAQSREWEDHDVHCAINWLARVEKLDVSREAFEAGLAVAACTRKVHPVREYLSGLAWDGMPRLSTGASTYFGTRDTPYSRVVFLRWMVSAVARSFVPGCQADVTFVLQGEQGFRKTTGFKALVPVESWYQSTGLRIGDKDSYSALRGTLIYVLDELPSFRDLERAKAYLTAQRDRYRPPYARREVDVPRQNIFGASTNKDTPFDDPTGNRRFAPDLVIREVSVEIIERDRNQLWAEAAHLWKTGTRWWADTAELRRLYEGEQSARQRTDPWEALIQSWLAKPVLVNQHGIERPLDLGAGVLTHEVLEFALRKPRADWERKDEQRIADILRSLGFVRGDMVSEPGRGRVRRYRMPEVSQ